MDAYIVSLLKAWWGDAATEDNDFCFDYLPRITGDHSTYQHDHGHAGRRGRGLLRHGREPGGRARPTPSCTGWRWRTSTGSSCATSTSTRARRSGRTGRRSRPASCAREDIGTEVFFLPAASHVEKAGTLHQHPAAAAVAPPGRRAARRLPLGAVVHATTWAGASARSWPAPTDQRDRPILDLTWDYPTQGPARRPRRRGGAARDQRQRRRRRRRCPSYTELKADGSTACGCWIYCGCYADGVNQAARRTAGLASRAGSRRSGAGRGRRTGASSTTAPRPTRTASRGRERKRYVWWDAEQGSWTGHDVPDFKADKAARLPARRRRRGRGRARAATSRSSCRATGTAGCSCPAV